MLAMLTATTVALQAQDKNVTINNLTKEKINAATPVKNQGHTGTCWSFSTTSLVESESLKKGTPELDLSEMFTARNIYIEKAKNYVRRQGAAKFDEGGLGHDAIRAMATYGIIPESQYSGLVNGQTSYDHQEMIKELKSYLDTLIAHTPIAENWIAGFTAILDKFMGQPPATFQYNGKTYTPQSYAKEVVKFDPNDYVYLTSFTHHPFNKAFIVEVPDNFSNGAYYNVPLEELTSITTNALQKGYTILWDADVSNKGFSRKKGLGIFPQDTSLKKDNIDLQTKEAPYSQDLRQRLYEELITQDDHLMHITGVETTTDGRTFYRVKNSWGEAAGPYAGYWQVSQAYFAINTITIIVPKAALDKAFEKKYNLYLN
ncbi:aminopeptidase [Chitinophaga silvatica]|uniref:Aminopeptidase n=2 Tax=Chitinophaga silvatica TaxID=2282649 RepID=A0A3E1Y7Q1_9BACT|nr:aminopeptidase [Chitinophaga silvatica]